MTTGVSAALTVDDLFSAHKRMLWGLSYRLTGCAADADDIVQDTFVRALRRSTPLDDPSWVPWLVRVTTNLGIDVLRGRRRQAYTGPWLPSPIEADQYEEKSKAATGPETRYQMMESVSFAFLLALEALTPRLHRLHHDSSAANRNLGSVFTIWDRLLGKFDVRDAAHDVTFGVPAEVETFRRAGGRNSSRRSLSSGQILRNLFAERPF
jgi:RNA polymerase sigma factor (sigma-70 family)